MKRLHKEGETQGREYQRFKDQVEKWKHMDQKHAERIANNLMGDKEKQLQTQLAEAMKIIEAQKLEIEQLKEMNIQLDKEKMNLITKYDEGYERLEEENEQLKEERHKLIQDAYQCHYDTWKAEQENIVITELKEEIDILNDIIEGDNV